MRRVAGSDGDRLCMDAARRKATSLFEVPSLSPRSDAAALATAARRYSDSTCCSFMIAAAVAAAAAMLLRRPLWVAAASLESSSRAAARAAIARAVASFSSVVSLAAAFLATMLGSSGSKSACDPKEWAIPKDDTRDSRKRPLRYPLGELEATIAPGEAKREDEAPTLGETGIPKGCPNGLANGLWERVRTSPKLKERRNAGVSFEALPDACLAARRICPRLGDEWSRLTLRGLALIRGVVRSMLDTMFTPRRAAASWASMLLPALIASARAFAAANSAQR